MQLKQNSVPQEEINALLNYFEEGIIAIDLETTGLSPLADRIIELSAIKIKKNRGVETFSTLINPDRDIPPHTTAIHNITDMMVVGSPKIEDILPDFLEFAGTLPIVAHNAKFDLGFIVFEIHQQKLNLPKLETHCSLQLAKVAFDNMPNNKLGTLAKELNISLENHHRAYDDAVASLRIFARGIMELRKKEQLFRIRQAYQFKLQDFDSDGNFDIPKHLLDLKGYVAKQEKVEIIYRGGSHRNNFRPVKPLALLPMPHGSILYALCLLENQHKSFKLTKISDLRHYGQEDVK